MVLSFIKSPLPRPAACWHAPCVMVCFLYRVRRALENTAKRLPGLETMVQGQGLVQVWRREEREREVALRAAQTSPLARDRPPSHDDATLNAMTARPSRCRRFPTSPFGSCRWARLRFVSSAIVRFDPHHPPPSPPWILLLPAACCLLPAALAWFWPLPLSVYDCVLLSYYCCTTVL